MSITPLCTDLMSSIFSNPLSCKTNALQPSGVFTTLSKFSNIILFVKIVNDSNLLIIFA